MIKSSGCKEVTISAKMTDDAIEATANHLISNVEKRHKRHVKACLMQQQPGYLKLPAECQCQQEKLQIEEGKKSPIMRSFIGDRRVMRRDGVAEMSEMERKLVKGALRNILKTQGMTEYQPS